MATYTHLAMAGHIPWEIITRQAKAELDDVCFKILVLLAKSPMTGGELAHNLPHRDHIINNAIHSLSIQGMIYHDGYKYNLHIN